MGYEVKIYCGIRKEDAPVPSIDQAAPVEEVAVYMEIVAMIDLCKIDGLTPSKTGPMVYFYTDGDGDAQITQDRYGDKCRTYPVADVLKIVRERSKRTPDYRRWKPAIALLENLIDFPGSEIECVIYGY